MCIRDRFGRVTAAVVPIDDFLRDDLEVLSVVVYRAAETGFCGLSGAAVSFTYSFFDV